MEVDELRVAKVAKDIHAAIDEELQKLAEESAVTDLERVLADIQQFQSVPQLLHSQLGGYVSQIIGAYLGDRNRLAMCEVFYTLAKVVGSKKMLNFFQTDVHLIPKLTQRFLGEELHWHEKYLLLCWLTVLALAPFKLDTLHENIKDQLHQIGHDQLVHSGPLQPLGARLLGSLIMRSDCDDLLKGFVEEMTTEFENASDVMKQGYLFAFNVALHKDPTKKTMDITPTFMKFLLEDSHNGANVDLIAKIGAKLASNLDELDDFEGQEDLVAWFDNQFANKNTDTRFTLARQYSKMITRIDQCFGIDLMLELIYGAEELLKESFETISSDKLHTYLLSLAELLRLDLIDYFSFDKIISILHRTFYFQQSRITHIAGANIRDASNFIAWSLAKYQRKQLEPKIVMPMFADLLLVCCFDKEILIRRSATAALQELVGRHGGATWDIIYPGDERNPARSIRVIEILDYIDLGSIEKSYLSIPQKLIEIFPHIKLQFIDFLTENVYNMDNDLSKLSSRALKILLTNEPPEVRDQVIAQVISKSTRKPANAFIALSETVPLITNQSILKEIIPVFNDTKINHHRDPPFIIIAYLSLLYVLLDIGTPLPSTVIDNVFDAIRVDTPEISTVLKSIAPMLDLNKEYWSKWIYYMKNSNLNTSSSVALLKRFKENTHDVVTLLMSERTDANVKAATIGSISEYLQSGNTLPEEVMTDVIAQLDDYSVSEQGDVGSKVRLAGIKLINENIGLFQGEMRKTVEKKLLRLAVEPIDRLREESVKLLLNLYGSVQISAETRDLKFYFDQVLQFFKEHYTNNKDASSEMLKGYIFSAGALKSTDTLITSSLHSFSSFYINDLTDPQRKEILLQIASVIKADAELLKEDTFKSQRHNKQILVGMQFLTRLLQTNIPIPTDFNMKGLYIRIHNLHLGTKNMTRLSCAIKIFGHMFVSYDISEAKARLCWLVINHPLARVRTLASEELYMVYVERYEMTKDERYKDALQVIQQVDWSGKNLKVHAKKIEI